MAQLTAADIYQVAREAGFDPQQAVTWTAIALAESSGRTDAHASVGENSWGLWQINLDAHANTYGDLTDPLNNARAAFAISHHGTDFSPWSTTHLHGGHASYQNFEAQAEAAGGGTPGDWTGAASYADHTGPAPSDGSSSVDPLPSAAAAAAPGSGSTTAQPADELVQLFEQLLGANGSVAGVGAAGGVEIFVVEPGAMTTPADLAGIADVQRAMGTNPTAGALTVQSLTAQSLSGMNADPSHPDTTTAAGDSSAASLGSADHGSTADAGSADPGSGGTRSGADSRVQTFLDAALSQRGDPYVWGATGAASDKNPTGFDCSGLTHWAAARAGVNLPEGSWLQYLSLKQQGALIPVDQAMHTPGALLFDFSSTPTPGGGRPSEAHVAISLGNGETIEARGTKYGVNEFAAAHRFNYAAVIPGLQLDALAGADGVDAALTAAGPHASESASTHAAVDPLVEEFERRLDVHQAAAGHSSASVSDAVDWGSGTHASGVGGGGAGISGLDHGSNWVESLTFPEHDGAADLDDSLTAHDGHDMPGH